MNRFLIFFAFFVIVAKAEVPKLWIIQRIEPNSVGWRMESSLLQESVVVDSTITHSAQYIAACTSRSVLLYRVAMYPNMYPFRWSHIFYGSFPVQSAASVTGCSFRKKSYSLDVKFSDGRAVEFCQRQLFNVNRQRALLGPLATKMSMEEVANRTRFHFANPADFFEDIWVPCSRLPKFTSFLRKSSRQGAVEFENWSSANSSVIDRVLSAERAKDDEHEESSAKDPLVSRNGNLVARHVHGANLTLVCETVTGQESCELALSEFNVSSVLLYSLQYDYLVAFGHSTMIAMRSVERADFSQRKPGYRLAAQQSSFYLLPTTGEALSWKRCVALALPFIIIRVLVPNSFLRFDQIASHWIIVRLFRFAPLLLIAFSTFEVLYQSAFPNDWPAHMSEITEWLDGPLSGSINWSTHRDHYHTHGPNAYPAGFLYIYGLLYRFFTLNGTLQIFQLWWAALELLALLLLRRLCEALNAPPWCAYLPILSNRLHLFNVRVVINDLPGVVLALLSMNALARHRTQLAALFHSAALSTKLNFILYLPGWALGSLRSRDALFSKRLITSSIGALSLMAGVQVLLAVPVVLFGSPWDYFRSAYNFSRPFLWDKSRNFKFLGRALFDSRQFHLLLFAASALCVLLIWQRRPLYWNRVRLALLSNYVFIVFARGLYTPFLCWYFYTFPLVCYLCGVPTILSFALFALHEILFRGFRTVEQDMSASFLLFCSNLCVLSYAFAREASKKKKDK